MKKRYLLLIVTAVVVVICDQITKLLAMEYLRPLSLQSSPSEHFITVIEGFFRLHYTENPGASWGLLRDMSDGVRVPFFVGISLAAIAFIVWFYKKLGPEQKLQGFSIALVLGGAIGNLIDRIRFGKVVDFIQWYVLVERPINLGVFTIEPGMKYWPTFNVADVAITIGVILLIWDMIFQQKSLAEKKK